MNKHLMNPLGEWNQAANEIFQKTMQQNLEIMGEHISRASDQLKHFSQLKNPNEFFNFQKDCINENMNACVECTQKIVSNTMEHMEELTKLCGSVWGNCQEMGSKSFDKSEKSNR